MIESSFPPYGTLWFTSGTSVCVRAPMRPGAARLRAQRIRNGGCDIHDALRCVQPRHLNNDSNGRPFPRNHAYPHRFRGLRPERGTSASSSKSANQIGTQILQSLDLKRMPHPEWSPAFVKLMLLRHGKVLVVVPTCFARNTEHVRPKDTATISASASTLLTLIQLTTCRSCIQAFTVSLKPCRASEAP